MKNKRFLAMILTVFMVATVIVGCTPAETEESVEAPAESPAEEPQEAQGPDNTELILATTTSTENSGLLNFVLPDLKEKTGVETKVVAVGTGKALQMGRDGEADILLVHAKPDEEIFVEEGHGLERFDVMYNDFVLLGPNDDPAKVKENAPDNIVKALETIKKDQASFVSRGDDSGTHKKELSLWNQEDGEPSGDWYLSVGKGMGDTIQMANEVKGYTLSDRATYLSMKENLDLQVVTEGDERLFNQYGVIAVNPDKNNKINHEAAQMFIEWILSGDTQNLIGEFGKEEFGQPLFIPNAK